MGVVMLEARSLPVALVMAACALVAQFALVTFFLIVLLVAGDALLIYLELGVRA